MLMILIDLSGLFDPFFRFFHFWPQRRRLKTGSVPCGPCDRTPVSVPSPVFLSESRTPNPQSRLLPSLTPNSCFLRSSRWSVSARPPVLTDRPTAKCSFCESRTPSLRSRCRALAAFQSAIGNQQSALTALSFRVGSRRPDPFFRARLLSVKSEPQQL